MTCPSIETRSDTKRALSAGKNGALHYLADHARAAASEVAAAVHVNPQAISPAANELNCLPFVVPVPNIENPLRFWMEIKDARMQKSTTESAAGRGWLEQADAGRLTAEERKSLDAVMPIFLPESEASVD
jgi:hypothetical protein